MFAVHRSESASHSAHTMHTLHSAQAVRFIFSFVSISCLYRQGKENNTELWLFLTLLFNVLSILDFFFFLFFSTSFYVFIVVFDLRPYLSVANG